MSPSITRTNGTSPTKRHQTASIAVNAVHDKSAMTNGADAVRTTVIDGVTAYTGHVIDTDGLAGSWSVCLSQPFTNVAVDAYAGHLLIDLQSTGGNVRMQLTRRDLPVMLKTFIDAIAQLTAVAE